MQELEFRGEENFDASQEKVFAALTDLDALGGAIPGVVSVQQVDERTLNAVARPGFSFLGGQIRLVLRVVEADPPESAVMSVDARSIGLSMSVESRLKLSPARGGGTLLAWEARLFAMKGLIAAAPAGLVRAAAEKVITDGWKALRPRIES